MSSPAGLHLQDLILDTKATASKEQKAEAVSEVDGRRGVMVLVERDAANFTTAHARLVGTVIGMRPSMSFIVKLAWSSALPGQWLRSKGD